MRITGRGATWISGLVVALTLVGCSSDERRNQTLRDVLNPAPLHNPDPTFVALAESGAPSFLVSVENRENALAPFVKQTENAKGQVSWISADMVGLATIEGMVISTRGLGGDMMAADMSGLWPLLKSGKNGTVEIFITHLTANDETKISSYRCQASPRGERRVDLGPYVARTNLMQSDCLNGHTTFQNLYWIEHGSLEIVQSRQWISHYVGTLALRKIPSSV
ncbi:YjbF family lipoprotein [Aliiroseovarius sp. KMU-50]|uniref:YjbF family lipoprotein n=1 Tax=Aliiroseovarius salicola TaxID=3009082 RepID=A0ABT4VY08_9RHOB|nr:YjbF family lipoprotein [Aliiroseovarius sp. KMU-50]MDA5093064.1 YjbF family lipoprotein [Aliiroseovarius sp. KMU-50]